MTHFLCHQQCLRFTLLQRVTSQQPQWLQIAASHSAQHWNSTPAVHFSTAGPPLRTLPLPGPASPQRDFGTDNASNLPDTLSHLRNLHNGAEIFLVGTAHVSSASAEEVRDVIRRVQPDTVMVELCAGRAEQMMSGKQQEFNFLKALTAKLGGSGQSFMGMLAGAGLQAMYRSLRYAGLDPGAEFKAAILEGRALNARIVYGDQNVQKTMARISQHLGMQNLMRMFGAAATNGSELQKVMGDQDSGKMSLTDQVEAMKTRKAVGQMMEMMRRLNPGLVHALVDERDQVMVDCLSKLQGRVVGVVGLGHLDGMERLWAEQVARPKASTA